MDYARGEALLESSDEEELDDELQLETFSDQSGEDEDIVLRRHTTKLKGLQELEALEVDLNEDDDALAELDAQVAAYNRDYPEDPSPATEGGQTRRIAAVNLDWDFVRASHLYKVFSSLVSATA